MDGKPKPYIRGEKGKEKQHTVNKKEIREKEKKDKEAEVRKVCRYTYI